MPTRNVDEWSLDQVLFILGFIAFGAAILMGIAWQSISGVAVFGLFGFTFFLFSFVSWRRQQK